ncbi:hypothetical protein CPIN17261_0566 [Campylobacter pinnipediorum subsp. pinnipediorum]|nr:hypothetical protein CPIN17261_0566 [Campylobacter pinnipediorum subsp. pinnipediorum]
MFFNNKFNIFHKVILAFFILIFLGGCGYKADPFYSENVTQSKYIDG